MVPEPRRRQVVCDGCARYCAAKLKLTGRRVQEFINACSGLPNKDMERFAADLEALIDKYKIEEQD